MDTTFLVIAKREGNIEKIIKFEDISFVEIKEAEHEQFIVMVVLKNNREINIPRDNMEEAYSTMNSIKEAIGGWTERVSSMY